MDDTSVTTEIRKFIADKIASGVIVHVDYLTAEIVGSKDAIDGDDLPFYRVCAHKHVRGIVKSVVSKYDAKTTTDRQLTLAGFEYLQVAYTFNRSGDVVLVPVDLCTDAELTARAFEYVGMAKGCRDHAVEIHKYVEARSSAADAA
jgi:hypothetical protein